MADLSEIFSGLLGTAGQYTIGSGAADSARASGALGLTFCMAGRHRDQWTAAVWVSARAR